MFINVVITLECLGHVLHTHIQTYTDTVLHTYIHTLTLHDCLSKYQVVKGHLWDEKIKIIQSK